MRHQVSGRKLNRSQAHRRALFRNLLAALVHHERIRTTDAKAKELRRFADRLITLGKQDTLAARRRAFARLRDRGAVVKLFGDIAPRFRERPGGYTRITKIGLRHGDAAPVSLIEWTPTAVEGTKEKAPAKPKRKLAARAPATKPAPAQKKRAAAG